MYGLHAHIKITQKYLSYIELWIFIFFHIIEIGVQKYEHRGYLIILILSYFDAMCNGVYPLLSLLSIFAPCVIKYWTILIWSSMDAMCNGVNPWISLLSIFAPCVIKYPLCSYYCTPKYGSLPVVPKNTN